MENESTQVLLTTNLYIDVNDYVFQKKQTNWEKNPIKTAAQSFGFKTRIKHIVRGAIIILNRGNDQVFLAFITH